MARTDAARPRTSAPRPAVDNSITDADVVVADARSSVATMAVEVRRAMDDRAAEARAVVQAREAAAREAIRAREREARVAAEAWAAEADRVAAQALETVKAREAEARLAVDAKAAQAVQDADRARAQAEAMAAAARTAVEAVAAEATAAVDTRTAEATASVAALETAANAAVDAKLAEARASVEAKYAAAFAAAAAQETAAWAAVEAKETAARAAVEARARAARMALKRVRPADDGPTAPASATRAKSCLAVRSDDNGYAIELQVPGKLEPFRVPVFNGGPHVTLWPSASLPSVTLAAELIAGLEEFFTGLLGADGPHCMGLTVEPLGVILSEARPVRLCVNSETLGASAVVQEQYVVFHLFLSYLDVFFHGTGGMVDRPDGVDAVEALVGPQGWRRSSEVRACMEAWAQSHSAAGLQTAISTEAQQEAQWLLSKVALMRDPTHVAKRTQGDTRFPYMCAGGRPKIGGARLTRLSQLSCIPRSCGRDRGCRLGFLVLSDLLQAVYAVLEALDSKLRASVKPLIGDLLLELDGKGPRVEGVPDAVRIAVAAAMASCARGWREAVERMDAWREAVQQSAVLAGLRGADDAPVLLTPHQALRRMQQASHAGAEIQLGKAKGSAVLAFAA